MEIWLWMGLVLVALNFFFLISYDNRFKKSRLFFLADYAKTALKSLALV
jgi:hypothetical protein